MPGGAARLFSCSGQALAKSLDNRRKLPEQSRHSLVGVCEYGMPCEVILVAMGRRTAGRQQDSCRQRSDDSSISNHERIGVAARAFSSGIEATFAILTATVAFDHGAAVAEILASPTSAPVKSGPGQEVGELRCDPKIGFDGQ